MYHRTESVVIQYFLVLFFSIINLNTVSSCSGGDFGKNFGQGAAHEISQAAVKTSHELRKALDEASAKLSHAMEKGIDATKEVVKELSGSISELAKSVNVKINSEDLKDAGKEATANLRDAIDKLSQNWNLSIDTADMKDFGSEAVRHLSEALKAINIKLEVYLRIEFDDNVRRSIMYISIAAGMAFSVFFVAMVISLKSCRKCTVALFNLCVEGCCRRNNNSSLEEADKTSSTKSQTKNNKFVNNFDTDPRNLLDEHSYSDNIKVYNELEETNKKKTARQSMAGFGEQKFSNLKNFWNTSAQFNGNG